MSFCMKCGSKLDQGTEVCPYCGARQAQVRGQGQGPAQVPGGGKAPQDPQASSEKRTRIILVAIAIAMVFVLAVLIVMGATGGGAANTAPARLGGSARVEETKTSDATAEQAKKEAEAAEQAKKEAEAAEQAKRETEQAKKEAEAAEQAKRETEQAKKEAEQAKKEAEAAAAAKKEAEAAAAARTSEARAIADAFTDVLDRVGPTFPRSDWPDSSQLEYKYFLAELNGDDVPELVVSLSTNPSDEYYYFFVYDPSTKTANLVPSEGVRNYHLRETWAYDPNGRALVFAGTYGGQVIFRKLYIAGNQLISEDADEATARDFEQLADIAAYDISDRSAIDSLAGI